jgi:hypothetical protein
MRNQNQNLQNHVNAQDVVKKQQLLDVGRLKIKLLINIPVIIGFIPRVITNHFEFIVI